MPILQHFAAWLCSSDFIMTSLPLTSVLVYENEIGKVGLINLLLQVVLFSIVTFKTLTFSQDTRHVALA